jgi:hypothetical protein
MNTETTIASGAAQLAAPELTQRPPRNHSRTWFNGGGLEPSCTRFKTIGCLRRSLQVSRGKYLLPVFFFEP